LDGIDNDEDGLVDCLDEDCCRENHCYGEDDLDECSDGIDNDED